MAATNKILSIDIGTGFIRAGEFEFNNGTLTMHRFDSRELENTESEMEYASQIALKLREIITANKFSTNIAHCTVSGQMAMVRFAKLPPVVGDEERIRKVVEFEAQSNVPFSMSEVTWDYQLIGSSDDEMDVVFVVIKNDNVMQLTNIASSAGIDFKLIEMSSTAITNCARANGIGADECAMILDIGESNSELIFIDGSNFFARSIPIAGATVSQQIAKEFDISIEEAEDLKRKHGFVSLGGTYEEPESEVQSVISKIIRNTMTRLHSDINRSKNAWRTQQKGTTPTKLFLTGGGSILPFTNTFFAEKMQIETSYLHPFGAVQLGRRIDREKLQSVAHTFAAVVGTALRLKGDCPVEINLTPKTILSQQEFDKRKPYLYGAMICFLMIFALVYKYTNDVSTDNATVVNANKVALAAKQNLFNEIQDNNKEIEQMLSDYNSKMSIFKEKADWFNVVSYVQSKAPDTVVITTIEPDFAAPAAAKTDADDEDEDDEDGSDEDSDTISREKIYGVIISGTIIRNKSDEKVATSLKAVHELFGESLSEDKALVSVTKLISYSPRIKPYKNASTFKLNMKLKNAIDLTRELK